MLKRYFLLLTILLSTTQFAQDGKDTLEAIEETFIRLIGQQAPLLAPEYYSDAKEQFNLLKEDHFAGYPIDELSYELEEIYELLAAADTTSLAALEYFSVPLETRNNCIDKNAEKLSTYYWNKAEKYFGYAIDSFVDEDLEDAEEYSAEALSYYTRALSNSEKSLEITRNWAPQYGAVKVNAELLSPVLYNQALIQRNRAVKMLQDDYAENDIEEIISTAEFLFDGAKESAIQNSINCASILEARHKARQRNAMLLAPQYWFAAEEKFRETCLQYIDEDDDYWETGVMAENYYNEATTIALSAFYLNKVDNAIDEAKLNKANEFAPITFKRSVELRKETLNKIGAIGDYHFEIKSLADEAEYEAKHASYISNLVQKLADQGRTTEEVILASENSIATIANAMNVKARFDRGYARTTEAILAVVRGENYVYVEPAIETEDDLHKGIYALDASELPSYTNGSDNSNYPDESSDYQDDSSQNSSLENLFADDEIEIIYEDDRTIIRLTGLVFPAASTRLENRDYSILDHTIEAIKLDPDREILVEAHTDSRASRNFNMSLSQERADAVKDYLSRKVSNDITATGYGENDPIGDNSTEEGRKINRRIEVIILKEGASNSTDLF
ncbi:MAG: OmpA family protein [Bacteroidetes bacterium]|nr:OmpA family protein [Bacteroidota bacterium]